MRAYCERTWAKMAAVRFGWEVLDGQDGMQYVHGHRPSMWMNLHLAHRCSDVRIPYDWSSDSTPMSSFPVYLVLVPMEGRNQPLRHQMWSP